MQCMESVYTVDEKLFESSLRGDLEGVRDALEQGARVTWRSPKGATPLLAAAYNGHTDICGLLLAHGSNVNEFEPRTEGTPLHHAAARGHKATVELLLSWGAAVDQLDHIGATSLSSACQEGHLACVLILLKAGADFFLTRNDGHLPIHMAAQQNRLKIVKTLLEHGCSQDTVSCSDITLSK